MPALRLNCDQAVHKVRLHARQHPTSGRFGWTLQVCPSSGLVASCRLKVASACGEVSQTPSRVVVRLCEQLHHFSYEIALPRQCNFGSKQSRSPFSARLAETTDRRWPMPSSEVRLTAVTVISSIAILVHCDIGEFDGRLSASRRVPSSCQCREPRSGGLIEHTRDREV